MGELQAIVTDLCKKDFSYAVPELKQRLAEGSRCIVCTLPLPCPHYLSAKAMPQVEGPSLTELPLYKLTEGIKPEFLQQEVVRDDRSVLRLNFKHSSPRKRLNLPSPKRLQVLEAIATYKERQIKAELSNIEQMKQAEAEAKLQHQRDHQRMLKRNRRLKELIRKGREGNETTGELTETRQTRDRAVPSLSVKSSLGQVRLAPLTRV